MPQISTGISYPRKRMARFSIRLLGRLLLPVFFQIELNGKENFPEEGPLLVVGNHTAAMEAVLLNIYSPWQIEMLSAADTPAEWIIDQISKLYGVILLHRGSYDRAALTAALEVLRQGGIIGLFPEGGIWQEGKKEAHPGISWLSYRSGAPVLPIGFSDTSGALNAGLKFQRPKLSMWVGSVLQPAVLPSGKPRKAYLQAYADRVMESVHQLVPPDSYQAEPEIINERFELQIKVIDRHGNTIPIPSELVIGEALPLAKFLHRPAILKIFRFNLSLPVEPLEQLAEGPDIASLIQANQGILNYLEHENPYLLTYRFGIQEGLAMERGLQELQRLLRWCQMHSCQIAIKPIRHYYSLKKKQDVTQIKQGQFQSWM